MNCCSSLIVLSTEYSFIAFTFASFIKTSSWLMMYPRNVTVVTWNSNISPWMYSWLSHCLDKLVWALQACHVDQSVQTTWWFHNETRRFKGCTSGAMEFQELRGLSGCQWPVVLWFQSEDCWLAFCRGMCKTVWFLHWWDCPSLIVLILDGLLRECSGSYVMVNDISSRTRVNHGCNHRSLAWTYDLNLNKQWI